MNLNAVGITGVSIAAAVFVGGVLGCLLNGLRRSTYGLITGAAAGVMLCAAIQGLLLSALEESSAVMVCGGMAAGAVILHRMNLTIAKRMPSDPRRVHGLMFVFAIAIHHFPEGLAAGVSFGMGETADTVAVCTAIALQNIPEAMMIMPAMAGYGRRKAVLAAAVSGVVEIIGLVVGYTAVQLTVLLLPILLALAAGAMLYVIYDNMLPDAYENAERKTTSAILTGYCGMLLMSELLEKLL